MKGKTNAITSAGVFGMDFGREIRDIKTLHVRGYRLGEILSELAKGLEFTSFKSFCYFYRILIY